MKLRVEQKKRVQNNAKTWYSPCVATKRRIPFFFLSIIQSKSHVYKDFALKQEQNVQLTHNLQRKNVYLLFTYVYQVINSNMVVLKYGYKYIDYCFFFFVNGR